MAEGAEEFAYDDEEHEVIHPDDIVEAYEINPEDMGRMVVVG
jgi:hypothetical protein